MCIWGHEASTEGERSGEYGQLSAQSTGEWEAGGSAGQEVYGKWVQGPSVQA